MSLDRLEEGDKEAHAQLGTLYSREDLPQIYNVYKAVEHLETVLLPSI